MKAVVSAKEAWEYVGGRDNFTELEKAFPDLMTPFRVFPTPRDGRRGKRQFLVRSLDAALEAAQMTGILRQTLTNHE